MIEFKGSQGTPEEIKEAEAHMNPQQKEQSVAREAFV